MLAPQTKESQANTAELDNRLRDPVSVTPAQFSSVFDGFDAHHPKLRKLEAEASRFCAAMTSATTPAYWLSLLGPSGTGKTMIARKILSFFRRYLDGEFDEQRGRPGVDCYRRKGGLLEWPRMVEFMAEGDFGFSRQACEDWLVVVDDIGSEYGKLTELATSKLFSILNARQGKFTILTANLRLDEIADKLDARIASRLLRHGGTVIDLTGVPDFSLK